jgi:cytochrome c peroxidase
MNRTNRSERVRVDDDDDERRPATARPKLAIAAITLGLVGAALPAAGCESPPASAYPEPEPAGGGAATSGAGGSAGSEGELCRTPTDDDLQPRVEFTDGDAATLTVPSCNGDAGPQGGGPIGGGPGGPGPVGGGPGSAAPGAGPGGGPGGAGPGGGDDGAAPLAILDDFPNEFGRVAQQQLLTQLGIFSEVTFTKNGRFCESCHANQNDWSLTPAFVQARFYRGQPAFTGNCTPLPNNDAANQNDELESIFRTVDGTNSPLADVSTPHAREQAYSMLLNRAVIRIGQAVPEDADFELVGVDDPYGFASAEELSLFRRPPSMANLRFNTTIMWDGREELSCSTLKSILRQQTAHAIKEHGEGDEPSDETLTNMVEAELKLYLAQLIHNDAGQLNTDGAHGGPVFLAQLPFYWGINAFDATDPQGKAYRQEVFSLYQAWRDLPANSEQNKARASIAEGERLFNTRELTIRGVSGFNDVLGRSEVTATCGACHNTPNVGTNSEGRLMDIGVSDEAERTADLPLYTFRERATGALLATTDPGQALFTKRWANMNRFKVPTLRGIASRPPYLHNGAAPSLAAVVDYHDQRFNMQLTSEDKAALVAFLSAL